MEVPNTPGNKAIASAIRSRMSADARQVKAQASLLTMIGVGAMLGLTGVGAGVAFFGYSFITDSTSQAEKVASAFAAALQKTTLKAEGTVGLTTNNAIVKLDSNDAARLKLDSSSIIKIDPTSTVRVMGDTSLPRPTEDQLNSGRSPASSIAVTNFTVFKTLEFDEGSVTTGWEFTSSENARPDHQYCYYKKATSTDGIKLVVDIAVDKIASTQPVSLPGFQMAEAIKKCIWYNN